MKTVQRKNFLSLSLSIYIYIYIGCINIYGIHVSANNSTDNITRFFLFQILK